MNRQKMIENYADLILQRGVGLKRGEVLVIEETSVTAIEFLRILTRRAYELGAKDVVVHFSDQELTKIRLQYADMETIESVPDWWVESREMYGSSSACFLRLNNDSPDGLCGVSDDKLAVWKRAIARPLQDLSFTKKENKVKWSASAIPGVDWAQKVFPGETPEKAVETGCISAARDWGPISPWISATEGLSQGASATVPSRTGSCLRPIFPRRKF